MDNYFPDSLLAPTSPLPTLRKLFALLAICSSPIALADVIQGRAVSIIDGDTIKVLTANHDLLTVRLMGIDAPEKRQDFGSQSKRHLSALVFNHTVDVEWKKKDRYGRIVGKVLLINEDINLKQIEAGLAWWYRKYKPEQSAPDRVRYEIAEQEAQERRQGLWSHPSPTPPWDWRHTARK
jgi:endonuclease YncB( thermonuclease family)